MSAFVLLLPLASPTLLHIPLVFFGRPNTFCLMAAPCPPPRIFATSSPIKSPLVVSCVCSPRKDTWFLWFCPKCFFLSDLKRQ